MHTVRINLLPWRDEARVLRENVFKRMLVYASLVGVALGLLGLGWMKIQVDKQAARVQAIESFKSKYSGAEQLLKKNTKTVEELRERLTVLSNLTDQRNNVVNVMNNLAAAEIEGVFIYGLDFRVDQLRFGSIADKRDSMVGFVKTLGENVGITPIPKSAEHTIKGRKLLDVSLEISPSEVKRAQEEGGANNE